LIGLGQSLLSPFLPPKLIFEKTYSLLRTVANLSSPLLVEGESPPGKGFVNPTSSPRSGLLFSVGLTLTLIFFEGHSFMRDSFILEPQNRELPFTSPCCLPIFPHSLTFLSLLKSPVRGDPRNALGVGSHTSRCCSSICFPGSPRTMWGILKQKLDAISCQWRGMSARHQTMKFFMYCSDYAPSASYPTFS